MAFIIVCAALLVGGAHSRTDFHTQCTLPDNTARFVFSPDTRGTLDILWSCLFTIAACTWTIQHLNVPEQRGYRQPGWKGDLWWGLKGLWSNGKWMVVTTIAPEYILGKAFGDLLAAYESKNIMKRTAQRDNVEWGLVHGFFANMGGFILAPAAPTPGHVTRLSMLNETERGNGLEANDRTPEKLEEATGHQAVHLTGSDIYALRREGILQKLPSISAAEISDKSKGDIFVKSLAVVQVFWTMLQVIVRTVRQLDVSQLELAVTAFSICAAITYSILFGEPKGVQIAIAVAECDRDAALNFLNNETDSVGNRRSRVIRFMPQFFGVSSTHRRTKMGWVSNDALENDYHLFGVIIGAVIFGSVHVAGWRLTFPTAIEMVLWRTSSIIITTLLPILFIPAILRLYMGVKRVPWGFIRGWDVCFGLLYVAARLFMLVEIFRSLGFLPASAYISTWTTNILHVA